jgi:hypothetical protein
MYIQQVMCLFRFLQSKDIFERFYKNKLSKRLLLGKSASYDLEKGMFKCFIHIFICYVHLMWVYMYVYIYIYICLYVTNLVKLCY